MVVCSSTVPPSRRPVVQCERYRPPERREPGSVGVAVHKLHGEPVLVRAGDAFEVRRRVLTALFCSHPSPRERAGVVGRGERLPHLRTERTSGLLAAAFEEFDAPESQYDRLGVDV